jgi:ABC-type glycerol-3-phosphate transport system substrate-binding protein
MKYLQNNTRNKLFWFFTLFCVLMSSCTLATWQDGTPQARRAAASQTSPAQPLPTWTVGTGKPAPVQVQTPTTTPTPKPTAPPDALKGTEIKFWHPWIDENARVIEALVSEFNRTNEWGILVKVEKLGGTADLNDKIRANLVAGDLPALTIASREQLLSWKAHSGRLVDFSPMIKSARYGDPSLVGEVAPVFWEQGKLKDGTQAVPLLYDMTLMFYNQGWAKELGYDQAPQTLAEFEDQACAAARLKNQSRDKVDFGTGGWLTNSRAETTMSWLLAFNARDYYSSDKGQYYFENEAVTDVFKYLRKLSDKGCAWTGRNPLPYDYFAARQALYYTGQLADIFVQDHVQRRDKKADSWTVIPFPPVKDKAAVYVNGLYLTGFSGDAAQETAAWLFSRWLLEPHNQAQLVESSKLLPVRKSAEGQLTKLYNLYPQFAKAAAWGELYDTGPMSMSWYAARPVLDDASWQLYQAGITLDQIPELLTQLDQTIADLLGGQSGKEGPGYNQ